jgi:hypothetical protein
MTVDERDVARLAGRTLIGAAEYVQLPAWGIARVRAKIDTGARTSALHVANLEELPRGRVRFDVVLQRASNSPKSVHVEARVVRRAKVRSSLGDEEERTFVKTMLVLGGVAKEIEIGLSARYEMRYRMLLGRTALADDFLVDPGRSYVETHAQRRRRR